MEPGSEELVVSGGFVGMKGPGEERSADCGVRSCGIGIGPFLTEIGPVFGFWRIGLRRARRAHPTFGRGRRQSGDAPGTRMWDAYATLPDRGGHRRVGGEQRVTNTTNDGEHGGE